jgi:hypothetical protein
MNSAVGCLIEFVESVASEEEDSFAVLQAPDKTGHQTVAGDILPDPLLQVYICLIQKKHDIPMMC